MNEMAILDRCRSYLITNPNGVWFLLTRPFIPPFSVISGNIYGWHNGTSFRWDSLQSKDWKCTWMKTGFPKITLVKCSQDILFRIETQTNAYIHMYILCMYISTNQYLNVSNGRCKECTHVDVFATFSRLVQFYWIFGFFKIKILFAILDWDYFLRIHSNMASR